MPCIGCKVCGVQHRRWLLPTLVALMTIAAQLKLTGSVSMLGFRRNEEVQKIFREAWVVAVPSIWEEPFGQIAIEAMMNGVAVVASNSGGLSEIVRDGRTGFLVRPGDTDAFGVALLRMLSERGFAESLGRAGHELAIAEFSETKMVDRFLQLYGSICSREAVARLQ